MLPRSVFRRLPDLVGAASTAVGYYRTAMANSRSLPEKPDARGVGPPRHPRRAT
jgi:hypothetical protein